MTTRLRFIKPWGHYKVGDIKLTESPTTAMYLTERHKVAVLEPEPERDIYKYVRKSQRDKMMKGPRLDK